MNAPRSVRAAGGVQVAQRLLQAMRGSFGQPGFGLFGFGQFAALADETRPHRAIRSPSAVQLRSYASLVERRIPHRSTDARHPFGICTLVDLQLQTVAPTEQHQTCFWFST